MKGATQVRLRSSAPSAPPAAKPFKDNELVAVIATGLPQHLPETRNQNEKPAGFSGKVQPSIDLAVGEAAQWLATGSADKNKAVIPQLQERYALPLKDAVEACRQAALLRAWAR